MQLWHRSGQEEGGGGGGGGVARQSTGEFERRELEGRQEGRGRRGGREKRDRFSKKWAEASQRRWTTEGLGMEDPRRQPDIDSVID